jgi:hypothetical protein
MHRATLADHEADLRAFIALLIDEGRYLEARDALRVLREEELHDFTRRSRQRAAASRTSALAFTPQERRVRGRAEPLATRMRAAQPLADARARPAPLESGGMGWLADPATEALVAQRAGRAARAAGVDGSACASRPPLTRRAAAPRPARESAHASAVAGRPPAVARRGPAARAPRACGTSSATSTWTSCSPPRAAGTGTVPDHAHRAEPPGARLARLALLNPAADAMAGAREFHHC